jgi:hypothetical protein
MAGTVTLVGDGPPPPPATRLRACVSAGRQVLNGLGGRLEDDHLAALNGPAMSNETGNRAHRFTSAPRHHDGLLAVYAHINDPCGAENSCDITLKDSLGSSVTVTLPPAEY